MFTKLTYPLYLDLTIFKKKLGGGEWSSSSNQWNITEYYIIRKNKEKNFL